MKNFPHQFNKIDRFARGLVEFDKLAQAGRDLSDDGIVGDALARAGVYTFRRTRGTDVGRLLREEHNKPPSSQGTRTMARELRMTFVLLGLLVRARGKLGLTPTAQRLTALASDPLGVEACTIWRGAFHALAVVDEQRNESHPYEIMLRLAAERPGVGKGLLGLALEAVDDSEAEFARLLRIVDGAGATSAWQTINVSRYMWDNSSKILPAVAEQLGELEVVDGNAHVALSDPLAPREESGRRRSGAVRSRRRRYDRTRGRGRGRGRGTGGASSSILIHDPDVVGARYTAHEHCLAAFDARFSNALERWEGVYDLLVVAGHELLLVEVKTIRDDASIQVRLGLGQLLYYEYFDIRPEWSRARVRRVLVTDRAIDAELIAFLDEHEVGLVVQKGKAVKSASPRAKQQLAYFGVKI